MEHRHETKYIVVLVDQNVLVDLTVSTAPAFGRAGGVCRQPHHTLFLAGEAICPSF